MTGRRNAHQRAAQLLARRMYTRKELEEKLCQDGYSKADIHTALEDFHRDGYLNDEEYIRRFVEDRRTFRPRGYYGLQAELAQRGIPSRILDTLREYYSTTDERSDALRLLESWAQGEEKPDRNRFVRRLFSRGFTDSAIENAWREMLEKRYNLRS